VASSSACSLGSAASQSGTGYEPTVVVRMRGLVVSCPTRILEFGHVRQFKAQSRLARVNPLPRQLFLQHFEIVPQLGNHRFWAGKPAPNHPRLRHCALPRQIRASRAKREKSALDTGNSQSQSPRDAPRRKAILLKPRSVKTTNSCQFFETKIMKTMKWMLFAVAIVAVNPAVCGSIVRGSVQVGFRPV